MSIKKSPIGSIHLQKKCVLTPLLFSQVLGSESLFAENPSADAMAASVIAQFLLPLWNSLPAQYRRYKPYITIECNSTYIVSTMFAEIFDRFFSERGVKAEFATPHEPSLVTGGKIGRWTDAELKENAVQLLQGLVQTDGLLFSTSFVGNKKELLNQLLRVRRELRRVDPASGPIYYITGKAGANKRTGMAPVLNDDQALAFLIGVAETFRMVQYCGR
jgi:hypothetical protein